jgi:hypothetical protein
MTYLTHPHLVSFELWIAWRSAQFFSAQVTRRHSVFVAQNQNWERSDQPNTQAGKVFHCESKDDGAL